jgi:hypothetical protein
MIDDRNFALSWRTARGPLRTHYGARHGEHPRYYIRHERRTGALFWIVYYRPGGLTDIELDANPNTLREAQRAAEDDLTRRVSLGDVPRLTRGNEVLQ